MIPFLTFLTNAINILLVLLVGAAPLLLRRGPGPLEYWLRSGLGIGIGVALAESGKHFEVWAGRPTFPSGHETLALAAGACLAVRDRRWLWLTVPLGGLQAWALIAGRFHQPVDVAGALLTGLIPPLLCHHLSRQPQTT